jgi:TrpR-related protein YerC/YecD
MKLHRNVSPRQEQAAERKLFEAMAALRTPEECRSFFRDLCTPAEIQAMADRWAVVEPIQRGLPYREIHKLTGVSVTTIGRVAKFVAAGNGGYELALRRTENGAKRPEAVRHG